MSAGRRRRVLFVSYSAEGGSPSLRILASILKAEYDTAFLFTRDSSYKTTAPEESSVKADIIAEFCSQYDYVLFSITRYYFLLTSDIADCIKEKESKVRIIIGGPYAILDPSSCLEHADYVCIFEGVGILELLNYLEEHDKPRSMGNFVCRKEDLPWKVGRVENLDTMPAPDYHASKLYRYTESGIVPTTLLPNQIYYETSRGCPLQCSFCDNAFLNTIKRAYRIPLVRFRSMKNSLQQLADLRAALPDLRSIQITSDNFFAHSVAEIETFSSGYDGMIGVPFTVVGDPRSPDFNKKIKALGKVNSLHSIGFGIQTGSEEFNRRVYNRCQDNEEIVRRHRFMKAILRKRVKIIYSVILGHPEEKKSDMLKTINLMLRLEGARFTFSNFISPSGTPANRFSETETPNSYVRFNYVLMGRFPFYYFFIFLIKYLRTYKLSFLLPHKLKVSFITEFLNKPFFSRFYFAIIGFSVRYGNSVRYGKLKRKTFRMPRLRGMK